MKTMKNTFTIIALSVLFCFCIALGLISFGHTNQETVDDTVANAIAPISQQITTINSAIDDLNATDNQLNNNVDAKVSELEAEIEELKKQINCLKGNHVAGTYTTTETTHTYICTVCETEVTEEHKYVDGVCVCEAEEIIDEVKWGASANALTGSGTFDEALVAVNAENSTVKYIQVQRDFSISKTTKTFKHIGTVVLDLNGNVANCESSATAIQVASGNLTVTDKIDGGQIVSSGYAALSLSATAPAGCCLTIENVDIFGGTYGLLGGSGTLVVKNSKVSAETAAIFVQGGTVCVDKQSTLSGEGFSFYYTKGTIDLSDADKSQYTIHTYTNYPMEISAVILPEGWALYDENYNEITTTVAGGKTVTAAESLDAIIAENYAWLTDAFGQNAGGTVTLTKNLNIGNNSIVFPKDYTTILDLNGYSLTSTDNTVGCDFGYGNTIKSSIPGGTLNLAKFITVIAGDFTMQDVIVNAPSNLFGMIYHFAQSNSTVKLIGNVELNDTSNNASYTEIYLNSASCKLDLTEASEQTILGLEIRIGSSYDTDLSQTFNLPAGYTLYDGATNTPISEIVERNTDIVIKKTAE